MSQAKASGGKKAKPTKLPPGFKATVKTPFGEAPRCQGRSKATKRQCANPARKGFPVCSSHGAGTGKREREGTRKNPKTAPITTGQYAQPETLELLQKMNPEFRALREHYLSKEGETQARDLRQLLASLWAMHDVVVRQLPTVIEGEYGEAPPALLPVMNGIASALERVARIEGRIAATGGVQITIQVAQLWVRQVVDLVHEFVPADRVERALARLEGLSLGGTAEAEAAAG